MKVAILLGSVRIGRQSHKIAYYLKQLLIEKGIDADLIDLAKTSLPILEERNSTYPQLSGKIREISQRLHEADSMVFITPEYHGSFSGVLKNALDYFWAEFRRKPIGVVTVSSGKMGGINASTQLQHVILSLGAFPLPLKLLVPEVHLSFNEANEPQNERIIKATEKFIEEYLWFADAIHQKRSKQVVQEAG